MAAERNLVGRTVYITDPDSLYYDEWGIVVAQDKFDYYVAIANGTDSVPVFSRDQIRVKKGA